MKRLLLSAVVGLALLTPASAQGLTNTQRITNLETAVTKLQTEFNEFKKSTNERISGSNARITAIEAFDAATSTRLQKLEEAVFPPEPQPEPEPEPTPEEEPTPEPEPEPTQTLHCFANPGACGYPTPSTTGVPAGTTLTKVGEISGTTAGQVIEGKEVTGGINITSNNVTVRNSRVFTEGNCGTGGTCGNWAIRLNEGVTGIKIENVETVKTSGTTCEHDIRNTSEGTLTITGSYLHACDSNIYSVGNTTLKDSYSIAKIDIPSDHVENVYFDDSTFSAIHDTMLNPVEQTAVIFGNVNGGSGGTCQNHLTVEDSLLAGGGYTLYPCGNGTSKGTSTRVVKNTHFARCTGTEVTDQWGSHLCKGVTINSREESLGDGNGYYPNSGSYNTMAYDFGGTWSGNVWDDNGAPVEE